MSRATRPSDTDVVDAFDLVIIGIRAGLTAVAALESAAAVCAPTVADGFEHVVHRFHRGTPLADALTELRDRLGHGAGEFADALATAERSGAPLVPVLDQLARDTRERRRRLTAERVRRLPVQLTFPMVMCTLPSFVLLAIFPVLLGAISALSGAVR
jgi:tight adherence protein C